MASDTQGGASKSSRKEGQDFIRAIVARHNEEGTYDGRVETRFPPEPNGYLHIGHTRPIVLNFGLARENGGVCHLRFDDTNPLTEDMKYVRAIQDDIRWLGYDWGDHLYFASDYFERLYECALVLIRKGKAYVDSLSEEEIREYRGTVTKPGRDSPYRTRTVEENLDLFHRMKAGEFENGEHVLRAKIDMAHANMVMRDPVLYRIRRATHYRRGDEWCIYPLYDFTHCLSDAFEDVTHSLCSMEFENNREIYDWLLDEVGFQEPRTHQYEFGRMNLEYTIVSKRKLMRLVNEGHVDGWDDPRMPTIAGMRRRGIPPEAIVRFTESVGVAKVNNRVDLAKLEFTVRDHLNMSVPRRMAVLNPLKVVITNYPEEGEGEELDIPSYPRDVPLEGSRPVPFSREIWIEADDFAEDPPTGFFRLVPGGEVRLRHAYFIRCDEVVRDPDTGEVAELRCSYDPDTKGGSAPDGRKVKGTIHWVSAAHGVPAEVRLYDRLFTAPDPEGEEGKDFTEFLNPESRVVVDRAWVEPSVAGDSPGTRYQFERQGYFMLEGGDEMLEGDDEMLDGDDGGGAGDAAQKSKVGPLVFNRIVTLRDTWGKRGEAEGETSGDPLSAPASSEPVSSEAAQGPDSGREARNAHRARLPALASRYRRYQTDLGLPEGDADILTGAWELAAFFEETLKASGDKAYATPLANWMVNEVLRELKGRSLADLPLTAEHLAALVELVESGTISQPVAKDLFQEMVEEGVDPRVRVKEEGLEKVTDESALRPLVDRALATHPDKVQAYREGKKGLMGFFMGQIMRETQGKADPELVKALLSRELGD